MALERAPADRTGTIGVEAFDATYGAGFQASDDPPHAVECKLVEDGAAFGGAPAGRRGPPAPRRLRRRHPTHRGAADPHRRRRRREHGRGRVPGRASPASRCPSGIGRAAAVEAAARAAGWLPGFASAPAPGRTGPGEPDADRGPRTASAPAARGRTSRPARGAGGGAQKQPRRTDGMIADRRPTGSPRPSATSHQRAVRARQPAPPALAGGAPAGQPWSPPPDPRGLAARRRLPWGREERKGEDSSTGLTETGMGLGKKIRVRGGPPNKLRSWSLNIRHNEQQNTVPDGRQSSTPIRDRGAPRRWRLRDRPSPSGAPAPASAALAANVRGLDI